MYDWVTAGSMGLFFSPIWLVFILCRFWDRFLKEPSGVITCWLVSLCCTCRPAFLIALICNYWFWPIIMVSLLNRIIMFWLWSLFPFDFCFEFVDLVGDLDSEGRLDCDVCWVIKPVTGSWKWAELSPVYMLSSFSYLSYPLKSWAMLSCLRGDFDLLGLYWIWLIFLRIY